MRFKIAHVTRYRYATPASESFMEARLTPRNTTSQTVVSHALDVEPACRVTHYTDYFGNAVEQFSIIRRHRLLELRAECVVDTHPVAVPPAALAITISEARQIYRTQVLERYDFLRPSRGVQLTAAVQKQARRFFRPAADLGDALHELTHWVHRWFKYVPGSTDVFTTVDEVFKRRRGVCQDFAHVMIAVLRSAEIPARYVCGYIETETQRQAAARHERFLVGAAESHAWVEVGLPNGDWYALDPTNDIPAGERHVMVSVGRDFQDTSPTRGVFKGAGKTRLKVKVAMRRMTTE